MFSKRETKELVESGEQFVADWLCWNQVKLTNLATVAEKKAYIDREASFPDNAADMGRYDDNGDERTEEAKDGAADWIYEGMCKAVKEYLADPEKWFD